MKYEKPEIALLGLAACAIQSGSVTKPGDDTPDAGPIMTFTTSAYQADE